MTSVSIAGGGSVVPPGNEMLLSEADIIEALRPKPLRTKDLIVLVKRKLRAHPHNKELFKTIIKKVASVRASASSEEDRLLELREEYK